MNLKIAFTSSAVLSVLGCAPVEDTKSRVEELRILAVRAEPPEVAPGTAVVLDALVADPKGNGRTVELEWALCAPDPTAGIASCADSAHRTVLGSGTSATLAVSGDALEGLPPGQAVLGIDLVVVLTARAIEDGEVVETDDAVKRVRVSLAGDANRNPVLDGLVVAGIAFAPEGMTMLEEDVALSASATDGSSEAYEGPLGPETEELQFAWFSTAGSFDEETSFASGESLAAENAFHLGSGAADIWVVLRDPRGGTAWDFRSVTRP